MKEATETEEVKELLDYDSENKLKITDKNTGEVVRQLPIADSEIISKKIKNLTNHKKMNLEDRIFALNDALKDLNKELNNNSKLPVIEAEETGIPVIDFAFRWGGLTKTNPLEYASVTLGRDFRDLFEGNWRPMNGSDIYEQAKPLGTVLNVTPNNDNVGVGIKTFIDSVIAGCPVLYKPGSKAPTALINITNAFKKHLPGYVDSVLCNTKDLYKTVSHPDLQGIVFTGKAEHGSQVQIEAIKQGASFVGEYEGTCVNYICKDSNLDQHLAQQLGMSIRAWNGIACASPHLTTVEKEIYEPSLDAVLKVGEFISNRVGNSKDPNVFVGPAMNQKLVDKYRETMKTVKDSGMEVLLGGEVIEDRIPQYTLIEGDPKKAAKFAKNPYLKSEMEIGVFSAPLSFINKEFYETLNWQKAQTPHKKGYHLRAWINSPDRNHIKELANEIPSSMITNDIYYFPNAKWTGLGRTSSTGNGVPLVRRLITQKSLSFAPKDYNPLA